jgi:hypothetical protein
MYLFENCALRDRTKPYGRLLKLRIADQQMSEPKVIAKGLDANCHQVRVIDDLVCVIDSANQAVLRFDSNGAAIDEKRPFPPAETSDTSGAYLHLNSLARIDGRVALLLHNGKALPARPSEIAWLDEHWEVEQRTILAGYSCHDLTQVPDGETWYAASLSGEIAALGGRRIKVSDHLMTRGIAFAADRVAVGVSSFGPRQLRDRLGGALVIFDRQFRKLGEVPLDGPPTDLIAL